MKKRLAIVLALSVLVVVVAATPSSAATATVTAPASAEVGETVTATVTVEDVPIVAIWYLDWGDETKVKQVTAAGTYELEHVYNDSGAYTITVTVEEVPTTTSITIETFEGTFADDDDSAFAADIEWLAAAGITRGCNPPHNTLFCPNQSVTRGQMAAFLSRAFDYTDATPAGFVDTVGHTFEADIDKLAAAGVTRGCGKPEALTFCPDDLVSRGQMAAFLVRAYAYSDIGDVQFVDIDQSPFAADILKLATAGVTLGCNPPVRDQYCPDRSVTRAQMAAFLHRAEGD